MQDWAKPRPKSAVILSSSFRSKSEEKSFSKPQSAGTRISAIEAADFLRSKHDIRSLNVESGYERRSSVLSNSLHLSAVGTVRKSSSVSAESEHQAEDSAKIVESRMQAVSAAYNKQLAAGRTPGLACISNTTDSLISAADTVFQYLDDLKARKGPCGSASSRHPMLEEGAQSL